MAKKEIDKELQKAHDEVSGAMGEPEEIEVDEELMEEHDKATRMKKGGCVKMKSGGSASARADGCAQRGKTRGRMV
jgi:hypothetical protein